MSWRCCWTAPAAASAEGGGGTGLSLNVQGLPVLKPPYSRISAIDMNKGEILWHIAHGETADNIRNHPALKGLNIPRTTENRQANIVVKNSSGFGGANVAIVFKRVA